MIKKAFSTLFFALFLGSFASAQTSEEELLYVSLGYKEQLLKGLDDKKGYAWRPVLLHKTMVGSRSRPSAFEFEGLIRAGETEPCAYAVIYRETEAVAKKDGVFWCIPHTKSGQNILAKAEERFKKEVDLNTGELLAYALTLQKLTMQLSQK